MIIKSVKIKGFKGFKDEFVAEFNEKESEIIGDNYKGKTSIGEAISWCLLGCNLFGNDKLPSIINKESDTASVELEFIDNNDENHLLIRKKGVENFLVLDGKMITNEVISKFCYTKKIFLSVFNPYYFSSLEPREQRDLLKGILPSIDYKDAFELLSQSDKDILVQPRMDLNGFMKNARDEIKELDKEEQNYIGKIGYAKQIISAHIDEKKEFKESHLLENLEREYENILRTIPSETKSEMVSKMQELDSKILKCNTEITNLRSQFSENQDILTKLESETSTCPVCGNLIKEDHKKHELIKKQNDLLLKIKTEGKELTAELSTLNTLKQILNIRCNILNPNREKEESLNNIKQQITKLKMDSDDIQRHNYSVDLQLKEKEKAEKNLEVFNKALIDINNEKEMLKAQIQVAGSLNNLIIKKQMDTVKEYLDRVKIVFSKIDMTTGEIKDDYKILYDDKEFNLLSLSEKIRATLEISNLINKIVGLNVPTFIDNAESITHYNHEFSNQVIIATVVKNKKLIVENNLKLVV